MSLTLENALESMLRRGFVPTLRPGILGRWGVTVLIGRNYIEAPGDTVEEAILSALAHCDGYTTPLKTKKGKK